MSRNRTRARRRRARQDEMRAEFDANRKNPAALAAMLKHLEQADIPIWPIARSASCPLTDDEAVMIAQIVAPWLAGMTAGTVHRRHKLA